MTQIYDAFNRWVGQEVDLNGDGTVDERRQFVQDGGQITLAFEDGQLTNRYLWSTAVDQLLGDERVNGASGGSDLRWALTNHLGSVRALADTNGSVVDTAVYDAFGRVLGGAADAAIDSLFGYTGRPLDEATGLQNNHHRWYDATTGKWLSEDPIGFTAGDANLYRYVGNGPGTKNDPSGLHELGQQPRDPVQEQQHVQEFIHSLSLAGMYGGSIQEVVPDHRPTIGAPNKNLPQFQYQHWYREYADLRQLQYNYERRGGDLPFSEGSRLAALEAQVQRELFAFEASKRGYSNFEIACVLAFRPGGDFDQAMSTMFTPGVAVANKGTVTFRGTVKGLNPSQAAILRQKLFDIPGVKGVYVFGSRTKGTSTNKSDLDVLLIGEINVFASDAISAKRSATQCAKELGIGPGKNGLYLDVQTFSSLKEAQDSFRNNPLDPPELSIPNFLPLQ